MAKDRAGNTLSSAKKLGVLDAKSLRLKDAVGTSDSDDVYQFSVNSSINFSGIKSGGAIATELYAFKDGKVLKNIGKTNFSQLKAKDLRNNLQRLARSRNGAPLSVTLASGNYVLRIRALKQPTQYTLDLSGQLTATPAPATNPTLNPTPAPQPGVPTVLYNGTELPSNQAWLDFNQIPTPFFFDRPPFLSTTAKTVAQTPGATGVTFKTDEDFTTTGNANVGYAGYSNYTAKVNSVSPLNVSSVLFNPAFPSLDRTTGFNLTFRLAVTSEVSDPNRAGFSVILTSQDAKGIELGFKSDRIFAQSSTFTEAENVAYNSSLFTDYKLAVKGDDYELFANNTSILKGALRTYQFDPATSSPPLPSSPYALPNFLFMGDDTDLGRASVTLGAITITQG